MSTVNLSVRIVIALLILASGGLLGEARGREMSTRATAATFTVNTTDDAWDVNPGNGLCAAANGQCTLRAAIMETNALPGTDTIILPAGHYQMTVPGTLEDDSVTGDLDIRGSLTINGAGRDITIIDMDQLDRAIDIHGAGLTVHVFGLTIQDALTEDTQNWNRGGGAFFLAEGNTLILDVVTLYNNEVSPYTLTAWGGGIMSYGEVTLDNTELIGNRATGGGGIFTSGLLTMTGGRADDNAATWGGGIWCVDASLDSVSISGNTGGGLEAGGTVTITGSSIRGNTGAGEGGGVRTGGVLTMTDCLVTENEATGCGGGIAMPYGNNYQMLTLIDSTVSRNTAGHCGGGIENFFSSGLTIIHSQIISNTVLGGDGGGIWGAPALVVDSTVAGNQCWGGDGGGIYQPGGLSEYFNTSISGNTAWTGSGGGMYGSEVNYPAPVEMTNSTISGNQAAVHGGGVFMRGSLSLYNATIMANVADSDANETGNGGGIMNDSGTVTLTHTILGENSDNSTIIVYPDCDGTFASQAYNLIQTVSPLCILAGDLTGNLTGINPELGPLQKNGGATDTHLPLAGSPVLDAGNPAGCTHADGSPLVSDQRGVFRPLDSDGDGVSVCDIGAVETTVLANLLPGEPQSVVYTGAHGNTTTIQIPGGAVTEPVQLAFSPVISVIPPTGLTFIQHAFELSVYDDGVLRPGYAFQEPLTITVQYAQVEIGSADEGQLQLMLFTEGAWSDAALTCDPPFAYNNDTEHNTVSLPICHLSLFGAFGPTRPVFHIYLPLVER